ncbi:BREX system P-loop protein BrxC [Microvirga tunisiensis]|uniref:BREX system P-loop protein BrxC n=1 Tax=Microvirga tunisiensis TaxID=2108360 RepID=A0A5N7MB51_9HYPH|nr:BREX system P-loop protein BrxC [Microvirga tunisiensis]MPR06289.1 BREX system P-loop protein BrxC [Microvirga tunisiensis]MPR24075.1 BREX system P-loop protein BrxC [Microvirga tunisiensis]
MTTIGTLFASDITRKIEEVIKVDQVDGDVLRSEIDEYIVTDAIQRHYVDILERYQEASRKPTEGVAIWISGFFGSGKSSFAKNLGLAIENREVVGVKAADRFAQRVRDNRLKVVLKTINEKIPTHAVIFDVSTDRGIRSGNQMLTEIMYRLFLESLGYARDLDLAELEIDLESQGRLKEFEETYLKTRGQAWNAEKSMLAFAINRASAALHAMEPTTYPAPDTWARTRSKADITPGLFARRVVELMERRKPGHSLLFVVDEVGQFVARDIQKMLDLQAIVQQLGVRGRGKHWIAVTSQEKLNELVSGLDDNRIELARLMDRFPMDLQVHLEPSDISEVTSRRVLAKNAGAETTLGKLFDDHRGRFAQATKLSADITLPELTRQRFVDLYPLLPYQIDLIIQIVSGLRTQGGASKHVGGANRTIIKLAQQLLINPATQIASRPVGSLVTLDEVYDLVEGNIASEVRAKISSVKDRVPNAPLAQSVAKVICLLQFVKSVHRSAENIAAALHPSVDGDSQLAAVKEALEALEKALVIRVGDDGYRIPTPAEDDWEQMRAGIDPNRAAENKLILEALTKLWGTGPTFSLSDIKPFKAGLMVDGKEAMKGDVTFHMKVAGDAAESPQLIAEARTRSQTETASVFWVITLTQEIRRELREAYRSAQMVERRGRTASTVDESNLLVEEKARLNRHTDTLRGYIKAASLAGSAFFRGNDRSPDDRTSDVAKAASKIMENILPDVYARFDEAAAKKTDLMKGTDALLTAENLNGLPPVFSALGLLRDEGGRITFKTDVAPLSEVMGQIEQRANYGDPAPGRFLEDKFQQAPFGWDFDAIRLFTLCLLRAGVIEGLSRGQSIETATSVQAKEVFSNNMLFRGATFRPKKGVDFEEIVNAAENYRLTFGQEIPELNAPKVAAEIRTAVERCEDNVSGVLGTMRTAGLPGRDLIERAADQMKAVRRGSDERAILDFNAAHTAIKEALQRAGELDKALDVGTLAMLAKAREVSGKLWPVLREEADLSDEMRTKGDLLSDFLERETFYRELHRIEEAAASLQGDYDRRYAEALNARVAAYTDALERLSKLPEWAKISPAQQDVLAEPLRRCADRNYNNQTIHHLRSEREACEGRLRTVVTKIHELLEGERLATVRVADFFQGGIETEEQLDQTLAGLRDEVARLIGAGKKVFATWGA